MKRLWKWITDLGIPIDIILSVVIAIGWTAGVAISRQDWALLPTGILVMLPALALIWFRDFFSDLVGSVGFHQIDGGSPSGLVGFFGWLALFGIMWMSASGKNY